MDYAMSCFETELPQDMQTMLRDYASIVNMPPIGVAQNYLFPALQLNVAAAQHGDSGKS